MKVVMTENRLRDEICRVGKSLFDRGYVHATAGNISVRLAPEAGGGYLITPTDACLGFLNPDDLTRMDESGAYVSGSRPSKTFALHSRIYDSTRNLESPAACVIHTHSTACVALTLAGDTAGPCLPPTGELLPPITPYFVMKVGHVPVIPYHFPGSASAANAVQVSIERYAKAGTPLRAVMLERLGPTVWHQSPAHAMAVLEELEETAKLYHGAPSQVTALAADQLAELCQKFDLRW
jgi:3-dehydro-4-phosphotetronate decarboxylase